MNSKTPFILIAEDNPEDRILIQEAFQDCKKNICTHFVENGSQLINWLRDNRDQSGKIIHQPDLILLDLSMPMLDGHRTLQYLKSTKLFVKIPVIVFSIHTQEAEINRAYATGANSFIAKPKTFEELVEIVCEIYDYWFEQNHKATD